MKLASTCGRMGMIVALAATTACEAPAPSFPSHPTFQLPELGEAVPTTTTPRGGAPTPPPTPTVPTPPPPVFGGGGSNGFVDPAPLEVAGDAFELEPSGAWKSDVPLVGTVTLVAPDHVLSTIVLPAGSGVTTLHPLPLRPAPPVMGEATVSGRLGPEGAGHIVSFRAPGISVFYGQRAGGDGEFSFKVPVAGSLAGVLVAVDRSDSPMLAIQSVTLEAGSEKNLGGLPLRQPEARGLEAPPLPAGMEARPSRLAILVGGARLDLAAFTLPHVPRYALTGGLTLAGVFEAMAPSGLAGSDVVTVESPPAFLTPPELAGIPPTLQPDAMLTWGGVPGAALYTLKLRYVGAPTPLWEGASPVSRIRLPAALSTGVRDLELLVEAWASAEVTPYSVASLRALRIPVTPQSAGGRHSWALRRGLKT